jgi:hypothetical protein
MKRLALIHLDRVSWPRLALGLAVPATLLMVGGGPASAGVTHGPAGVAHGAGAAACTVSWVGSDSQPMWTIGENWSTDHVPGPDANVCITTTGDDVLTPVSVSVRSLTIGAGQSLAMEGSASKPLTLTVATTLSHALGGVIDLTDTTVHAARIDDQGGTIYTDGNCALSSPDIVFHEGGSLQAANGTTALASLPQLANGTLKGATIDAADAVVMLPGDITHLIDAGIGLGADATIEDPAGNNALTGLTSADRDSSLTVGSNLSLTGNLTAAGIVTLEANLTTPGTFTLTQGQLTVHGTATLQAYSATIDAGAEAVAIPGTFSGNLVNDGQLETSGPSATKVTGNYTQGAGAVLDAGFDGELAVAGQASLAGEASAFDIGPVKGAKAPVITFGYRNQNFTSVDLGYVLATRQHEILAVATPQISAAPTTVAPGGLLIVNGASFEAGNKVEIFLNNVHGQPLGSVHDTGHDPGGHQGRLPQAHRSRGQRLPVRDHDHGELTLGTYQCVSAG